MAKKYIAALDQGTTSSRCIIFDKHQNIISTAQKEFPQIFPKSGWVEHNPIDIYVTQYSVLIEAIAKMNIDPREIAGIGITNQRETTIIWDRDTGLPIYNAIVWQCRRTADICKELLKDKDLDSYIKENTGLRIDAYFCATKIKWILDNVDGARKKAEEGKLMFGIVDSWLLYKLTNGKVHITDYTNASRTMLFNIKTLKWDDYLLKKFNIPKSILPEVHSSSEIYGYTNISGFDIPICAIAGDQQAALFGQTCFNKGDLKNTYGTGNFILMNTGEQLIKSSHGLISTIAYAIDGKVNYALEGSVFIGGAVIQWLRDEMRFFNEASDSTYFASKLEDNDGVYFVPAFTGLGAPYWDMEAKGVILGLTRGTSRNHIIRAALESIAFQSRDVIEAMCLDSGIDINEIKVDGGVSKSSLVMQFQADISNKTLRRPIIHETTALGIAYLAGLCAGIWKNKEEIKSNWSIDKIYTPSMDDNRRNNLLKKWNMAINLVRQWKNQDIFTSGI